MTSDKPKFKPVITRVKLNPEQAVLQCNCFQSGFVTGGEGTSFEDLCYSKSPGQVQISDGWTLSTASS